MVNLIHGRSARAKSPAASRFRSPAGFTLVETMTATMILAIVLASVLAIGGHCMRYLNDLRRTARSSQVLQQKMEDIRLLTWTQMQALTNHFTDPRDPTRVYQGRISTSAYDTYSSTTTALRVTLSVTWTNQSGRELTNQLSTVIANGGLNKYIF